MGLAEKKAIRDLLEGDFPRFQKYVTENGVTVNMEVDWDSLPDSDKNAIDHAGWAVQAFRDELVSLARDPLAKEELNKQIDTVRVRHDGSLTDQYAYSIKKEAKTFVFSANLTIFTISGSSSNSQKLFRTTMSELL